MVRGLLGKLASRSLSVAGKWQQQQLRRLNIHEYQVPTAPLSISYAQSCEHAFFVEQICQLTVAAILVLRTIHYDFSFLITHGGNTCLD